MTFLYREPAPEAPAACPCLACHVYGPYCADTCVRFEAWERAGRPGRTGVTITAAVEQHDARG